MNNEGGPEEENQYMVDGHLLTESQLTQLLMQQGITPDVLANNPGILNGAATEHDETNSREINLFSNMNQQQVLQMYDQN